MSSTKILLTGATGLVGEDLLNHLLSFGFKIIAISREKKVDAHNLTWVKFDILKDDINVLAELICNNTVVIHNAACIDENSKDINKVNVDFTKNILKKSIEKKALKFIFTSGTNFIKKPLPFIIDENVELMPTTNYGNSKYLAEKSIEHLANENNFPYFIFRLSSPLPDTKIPNTVLKIWINQAMKDGEIIVFGSGKRVQDFITVHDYANVCNQAILSDKSGIFNIASGSNITMIEIAEIIAKKFGAKIIFKGEEKEDIWNISIEKAKKALRFHPRFDSKTAISNLIGNL